MTSHGRLSIIIVGGGASGVLLAAHLLRDKDSDIRVTLIERRDVIGRGVAYSARQWDHLLNVAAPGMSAFADDPDHFWRWLRARDFVTDAERFVFMPRRVYGEYLAEVLRTSDDEGRLQIIHDECTGLQVTAAGIEASLGNGSSVVGHVAVLAVGHEENPARGKNIAVRVGSERDTPLNPNSPVMILGSGLSMVDAWLSLAQADHRGPITVVSRHGLLPQSHKQVAKIELDAADVPFGTDLHYFTAWFRDIIREVLERGGDWRSVVDALRPFNQRIWQNWSDLSRKRFLEHLRPFWNIHRHRLPPQLHERLRAAVASGQVRLVAGKFLNVERDGDNVRATVRRKGRMETEEFNIARVYDCGGVTVDVEQSSNPVVRGLLAHGDARPDRLHIGLDVTRDCEVVDQTGTPASRLFAIGPR
jgi:uncharacterized NAD(P)/FAD-binding protein YdhS